MGGSTNAGSGNGGTDFGSGSSNIGGMGMHGGQNDAGNT